MATAKVDGSFDTLTDGTNGEGPFVDDAAHGRWVFRDSDGNTCAVEYVKGEQQGECK